MSETNFSIDVNPDVLKSARTAAGQTIADVAKRLGVSADIIDKWETGHKTPAWNTLRKLAKCYQRPLAALLLSKPPREAPLPTDFRTVVGARRKLSSETLLAIRTARWLQSRAVEIHHELDLEQRPVNARIRTTKDVDEAASGLRRKLGIDVSEQIAWKDSRQAFRRWKEVLEEQDVLVFQFRFPREELQGFSLYDSTRPVIVVNEADSVEARIFTLFHECAHLLLREPGICSPLGAIASRATDIEAYCNQFAASLLISAEEAISWNLPELTDDETERHIKSIALRYHVSRFVVLIWLKTVDRIPATTFSRLYKRWVQPRPSKDKPVRHRDQRPSGGPSAIQICMRQRGKAFTTLVLNAIQRGAITTHDAMMYLGVKSGDIERLESKL